MSNCIIQRLELESSSSNVTWAAFSYESSSHFRKSFRKRHDSRAHLLILAHMNVSCEFTISLHFWNIAQKLVYDRQNLGVQKYNTQNAPFYTQPTHIDMVNRVPFWSLCRSLSLASHISNVPGRKSADRIFELHPHPLGNHLQLHYSDTRSSLSHSCVEYSLFDKLIFYFADAHSCSWLNINCKLLHHISSLCNLNETLFEKTGT